MADLAVDNENKCNMVMSMLQDDATMKLSLSGVAYENNQHEVDLPEKTTNNGEIF